MLAEDYDGAADVLDVVVGRYQKAVEGLKKDLTPQLKLPQPAGPRWTREEVFNPFDREHPTESNSLDAPQLQTTNTQWLHTSLPSPAAFLQLPSPVSPSFGTDIQPKAQIRRASAPTLVLPAKKKRRERRGGPRAAAACDECKRRKIKCGEGPACLFRKAAMQRREKAASFPQSQGMRPSFDKGDGGPRDDNGESSVVWTPLDVVSVENNTTGYGNLNAGSGDLDMIEPRVSNTPLASCDDPTLSSLIHEYVGGFASSNEGLVPYGWGFEDGPMDFNFSSSNPIQPQFEGQGVIFEQSRKAVTPIDWQEVGADGMQSMVVDLDGATIQLDNIISNFRSPIESNIIAPSNRISDGA